MVYTHNGMAVDPEVGFFVRCTKMVEKKGKLVQCSKNVTVFKTGKREEGVCRIHSTRRES